MRVNGRALRLAAALFGLVAVFAVAGCNTKADGKPSAAGQGSGSPRALAGSDGPGGLASPSADLATFVKQITSSVNDYWTGAFSSAGATWQPITDVRSYTKEGEFTCGGQKAAYLNNAYYCPPDNYFAYDATFLQSYRQKVGDAFVFFLVAHEMGHGVQDQARASAIISIQTELQADCLAGAYFGDTSRAGKLPESAQDVKALMDSFKIVGDGTENSTDKQNSWFAVDAHGTASQRTDSFNNGYKGSWPACHLDGGVLVDRGGDSGTRGAPSTAAPSVPSGDLPGSVPSF